MKKWLIVTLFVLMGLQGKALAAGQQSERQTPEEIQPVQKTAYLTFDDGPSLNTMPILDVLDHYGVKATFFVIGNEEGYAARAYREMVSRGHAIALHTYSHDYDVAYGSVQSYFSDMERLESLLQKYGVRTNLVRFPGGSKNRAVLYGHKKEVLNGIKTELAKKGYTYVDWNIDSTDGYSPSISKYTIVSNVLKGAKDLEQSVILLHDINSMDNTVRALPEIITGLKEQGYEFDVLNDYTAKKVQFGQ
ncbi:polysaccharide deacetylase family protein [Peribacillus kribbensis]|uniref:polysaccharide deacetylase family protein n=1 Tax=Peribacillus kribbensis TaxID=356658 RepID=UPI00040EE237|nr:polysaccharide deacetylase family protein [Peribacillus kribbensis]